MKRIFPITIVFATLALSSCAPLWQRPPQGPTPEKILTSPVDQSLIEDRISRIKKALERHDLTASERTVLYSLLEAYQGMESLPPYSREREYYRTSIRRLFFALSSMEDLYLNIRPQGGAKERSAIRLFTEKTNEILNAYLAGNYKAVIDKCVDLKESLGPDALTPEVGLVFALSLAQQGMIKDAVTIGERIANRLQTRPDLVVLRAHLAMWHLKMGDKQGAIRNYEKLADLLDERHRIEQTIAKSIGPLAIERKETVGKPGAPGFEPERETGEARSVSIVPLDEFLGKVRELVEQKKFELARDLIKRRRHQTTSAGELERLTEAMKEVDTREDQFLQERISVLSEQSQGLRQAEALIEEEKYDEALAKLNSIGSDLTNNVEVGRLKKAAIEGIINRERNRAAKLFLAAKQSNDPVKKERYLKSCLEILKSIVEKYPSSPLIPKVKDHITKVTEELEKLG